MTTRWERYYKKEMRKPKVKKLMEKSLELGEYHISLIKKGLRVAGEGKLVSHAEVKKLIAKMGRKKRGSPANVRKALKILARAGKKNPPVPGDEVL